MDKSGGAIEIVERGTDLFLPSKGITYSLHGIRSLWVSCHDLTVQKYVDEKSGEPRISVRGIAELEKDRLAILGRSQEITKLSLTIFGCEWPPEAEQQKETDGSSVASFLQRDDFGCAELGFSSADWEIGNPDDWWLQLTIPRHSLDALAADVVSGRVAEVVGRFRVQGLYVHDTYAPPSVSVTWYFRPASDDGDPDIVFGKVTSFSWQVPSSQHPKTQAHVTVEESEDRTKSKPSTEKAPESQLAKERNDLAKRQIRAIWWAIGLAVLMYVFR